MIKIIDEPANNLIETIAIGHLDASDYEKLVPMLEDKIRENGKVRWYFGIEGLEGWTPGAAWQDLKLGFQHAHDFERIAVVGEKHWQEWLTKLMKPFVSAEVRYFDKKDQAYAQEWIRH